MKTMLQVRGIFQPCLRLTYLCMCLKPTPSGFYQTGQVRDGGGVGCASDVFRLIGCLCRILLLIGRIGPWADEVSEEVFTRGVDDVFLLTKHIRREVQMDSGPI